MDNNRYRNIIDDDYTRRLKALPNEESKCKARSVKNRRAHGFDWVLSFNTEIANRLRLSAD